LYAVGSLVFLLLCIILINHHIFSNRD